MSKFSQGVQLGDEKFHIHAEDPVEMFELARRVREMHQICGGSGRFRVREAEKKKGRKTTVVTYREMVRSVPKLPFDPSDYAKTYIKMRISPETEPKYEQWPFFIYRTQRWNWHNPDTDQDYFLDTDGKWYEGTYDADAAEWSRKES